MAQQTDGDVGGFYRDDLEGRTPILFVGNPRRYPSHFDSLFNRVVADMNAQWLAIDMLHEGYYGA